MSKNWMSMFLPNPRILVAEDDEDLGQTVEKFLTEAGAIVRRVYDGQALVGAVKEFDPDLVISDVHMPHLRGDQALTKIRRDGFSKPFIFLSGDEDRELLQTSLRNHAYDFILKPFSREALKLAIQNALNDECAQAIDRLEREVSVEALSEVLKIPAKGELQGRIRNTARKRLAAQRAPKK
jgi:DNA-binding response OmpR family regulator